jgi:hypothetical protein
MLLMITLHFIRRSLRPKGDGNGTRLGLDSRAFAERGHCALRSENTEAVSGVMRRGAAIAQSIAEKAASGTFPISPCSATPKTRRRES